MRLYAGPPRRLLHDIVGGALLLAGLGLAATTERALLMRDLAAARHGVSLHEDGATDPHAGLVRIAGVPEVVQPAHDDAFNLTVATPVLTRHVAMFQWRELRMGGQPSYEMDWSEQLQDSRGFVHPRGHANPRSMPLEGTRFDAGEVRLGHLVLGRELARALPGSAPVAPEADRLPANLKASFTPYQGYLVTSADPARPRLGDVRVSWESVPLQQVTVFARRDGDRLVPPPVAAGGRDSARAIASGDDVQVGDRSFSDLLPDVPQPQRFTPWRRAGAVLLAALGTLALLWARRRRAADTLLALAVGISAVSALATVVWLGGRLAPMFGWLLLTVLGMAAIGLLWRYLPGPPIEGDRRA